MSNEPYPPPLPGPPPYQGPPTYQGYPGYPGYPAQPQQNGLGTASMVLGIIAVVGFWSSWPALIMAVLAIIFGGVGISRANSGRASNKGMAVAGLVLGIVAIALFVLAVVVFFAWWGYSTY